MATHYKGTAEEIRALNTFIKLMRGVNTLTQVMNERYRHCTHLTESQFGTLEVLLHLGPQQQNAIGEKLLLTGGNMTLVIDNLEKRKLVRRERNPEDRRCITVYLTEEGKKMMEKIFPDHVKYITELMSVLSAKDQDEMGRLAKKLGLSLKEKTQHAKPEIHNQ